MSSPLPPGYALRLATGLERQSLVQVMRQTYEELFPGLHTGHLVDTVERYLDRQTPIWWVDAIEEPAIGCLWVGTAIDQTAGERQSHIFLLYVSPPHRRQGIGTYLLQQAEDWARSRGDRHIGLQVFQTNQPALQLYQSLGYHTQSLWMVKSLEP